MIKSPETVEVSGKFRLNPFLSHKAAQKGGSGFTGENLFVLILVEYVELLMAQGFTLAGSAGGHICHHGGKGVGTLGKAHGAVEGGSRIKVHVVNHAGV